MDDTPSTDAITCKRAPRRILPSISETCAFDLRRRPLTTVEPKTRVDRRYDADEARVPRMMSGVSSWACGIFDDMGLKRSVIRGALQIIGRDRALQPTLRNAIRATRFKYSPQNGLRHTVCQPCGQIDGFGTYSNPPTWAQFPATQAWGRRTFRSWQPGHAVPIRICQYS